MHNRIKEIESQVKAILAEHGKDLTPLANGRYYVVDKPIGWYRAKEFREFHSLVAVVDHYTMVCGDTRLSALYSSPKAALI